MKEALCEYGKKKLDSNDSKSKKISIKASEKDIFWNNYQNLFKNPLMSKKKIW